MRPTRKKRHTSWKGYVQRRKPKSSSSSSREPNPTRGWEYDINMNKEIEIEMRKDCADEGREVEREGEGESRDATSGSTRRLSLGGGQWEQPYARFACEAQERLGFI
jgi:hypothetical protein